MRRRSRITGRYIRSYNLRQVSFLIQRKVGRHGTVAKKYGQQIVEEVFPKYEALFDDAVARDIEYQIAKYYPDLVK